MTIRPDVNGLAENFVGHKLFFSILENEIQFVAFWKFTGSSTVKLKKSENPQDGIRGGGVLDISLGGEVQPVPHSLTLFKTKIVDFSTLFKTEFRFLMPCLRHLTRNHILRKTIINKNFAAVYFVEHTRRLFIVQEKVPCLRQKLIKSMP